MNRILAKKMRIAIKSKGVLEGSTLLDAATNKPKCHRFSRVPYALPPTGHRRWRRPEPLPASFTYGSKEKPGRCTRPSASCPQLTMGGPIAGGDDEDCLHLNVWVPVGEAPRKGWPVIFYIHGGFLQFGSNSADDPSVLISSSPIKAIFISPNYRLGILGFLTSSAFTPQNQPIEANFGFWDQRLALEWSYENVAAFGGDKDNITVAGLSAGAYSVFHQMAHDISPLNKGEKIVKRVIMWSNGCGVQPKSVDEAKVQFDELVSKLGISAKLPPQQKVEALRRTSVVGMMKAVGKMGTKFFRPVADGSFIDENLFRDIYSGAFGKRMHDQGIKIMIGDLTQEFHVYKMAFPPKSFPALVARLCWDYPRVVVDAVCAPFIGASKTEAEWVDVFGRLYADLQIHSTMRGFIQCIAKELPASDILRYRIDYRTASVDKRFPKAFGATHSSDLSIWLYGDGDGDGLKDEERLVLDEWLMPMKQFSEGAEVNWGTESMKQVRLLTHEGKIETRDDEVWDEKIELWETTVDVTKDDVMHKNKTKL